MISEGPRPEIFGGPESRKLSLMKIGGWGTRLVFERYAIVDHNDIAAAMKKLLASDEKNRERLQFGYS
jgi:hypothetical protein